MGIRLNVTASMLNRHSGSGPSMQGRVERRASMKAHLGLTPSASAHSSSACTSDRRMEPDGCTVTFALACVHRARHVSADCCLGMWEGERSVVTVDGLLGPRMHGDRLQQARSSRCNGHMYLFWAQQ